MPRKIKSEYGKCLDQMNVFFDRVSERKGFRELASVSVTNLNPFGLSLSWRVQ